MLCVTNNFKRAVMLPRTICETAFAHAKFFVRISHIRKVKKLFNKKNFDIFTVFMADVEAHFNTNAPAVLHKP